MTLIATRGEITGNLFPAQRLPCGAPEIILSPGGHGRPQVDDWRVLHGMIILTGKGLWFYAAIPCAIARRPRPQPGGTAPPYRTLPTISSRLTS